MMNRPRLKRCCDACRASKVRCEGQKPSCKRCIQSQYSCIYSLSGKVGRPSHKQARRQNNSPPQGLLSPSEGNSRIGSVLNTPISTSINVAETGNNITTTSTSEDASENMPDVSLESILLADGGAAGPEFWAECILPGIDPPSTHSVPFSGCATAIANTQSDAESFCRRLRLPDMAIDNTPHFRSFDTISRQLSTIMTCSCSMQSGIGLGVATTCLAILDGYRAILRQMMGNASWKCTQQHSIKEPEGIAIRFLQEVHTFSNVVNQFEERYSCHGASHSVPAVMSAVLQDGLQSVIRQAIRRLQSDIAGDAPSTSHLVSSQLLECSNIASLLETDLHHGNRQ
ncbi:hypothetical protein BB8028_0002g02270 [Beauveria bassiana]|uniref:Zn(2)-C6 fungal-type domain-containing protein n=1 Tax=Beauveria bassiana TaxID=176275 RepID=A0A2S7Y1V0_BEABA|nr:hypothetical protein BB8028_0002g02270 [Beauveria bassiana]